ncbi:lipocalin-like domain-containing protein [Chitinophaga arvensicola]|uniref:Lipocalin-like domain-containing protein n=1 Tax=Chitinophaga arvensicola TaxID=29529 RepID=A0A1I0QLL6_9BACT|nr:hypothetical protein [Chitinophaga arvensicola]SEW27977.1 hypothetical protein SAMN04488122_1549 [Chitinophaga arvensicola]
MKIHFQFVILSLLLFVGTGCNKKETPHITSIEGKWQLIESVGGFAGARVEIKDKVIANFQNNEYRYYFNDTLMVTSTYEFVPIDDKTWKLTIHDGWNSVNIASFTGNLLVLYNPNPEMYTQTFRKVK